VSRASETAYSEIRSLILSGEAPPGTRLKEEELAELCGVSRTPVRDALRRLEAELYVVRTDSSRVHVADFQAEDVDEIFTLRAMLEAHAAARAATRMTETILGTLKAANDEVMAAVAGREADVTRFIAGNRRFHDAILETARSARLKAALALLVEQPIIRRTAQHYGVAELRQSAAEHAELVQALAAGDPDWAAGVMTAHIRRAYHAFADAARRLPSNPAK
jgi:DNA-binding GntR family transcriptional regulator